MSCRRAFDLDLADFVAGSARPEWAEFRAHYARCAECSAEVRAWTELHLLLQAPAAHPAEELLLRFETEPGRLPVDERRAVEEHLARCPSCNDELAALRRFDFTALEPRAAAAPTPRSSLAERLRRLVLHPAFAYAIVLLLLYPALEGRLPSRARQAAREDRQTVAERPAGESAPAARQKLREPAAPANLPRSENDALMRARKETAPPAAAGRLQAGGAGGAERLADEKARIESQSLEKAERYVETRAATPERAGWKALALSGPGAPVDVAAPAARDGRARELWSAVRDLPPEEQRVLDGIYRQGKTYEQVCAETGLPLGTMKRRLRDGLLALRRRFAEDEP